MTSYEVHDSVEPFPECEISTGKLVLTILNNISTHTVRQISFYSTLTDATRRVPRLHDTHKTK